MISKDRLLLQQQVYNFLRTVTIKYDMMAQYVNNIVIQKRYTVNFQDPTSWKYYLNMKGEYHPSDTLMYVSSLETQETILFSPSTLENHPRTKAAYLPGGIFYSRLCETYPDQVDLIKSILFPIEDIEKAINADNFTLLSYGEGYLEDYEVNPIVSEIEKFLEIFKERWYFDFLDDEPYFYITVWGVLWTYLAMVIMTARENFINTPYVHTWHIWNKLKSEGLSDYSDILDRKKSMMLYQNIDYLKANAGKQSNLVILANRLLSDFGISIYGRRIIQETESGSLSHELTPQLQAVRIPIDDYTVTTEITNDTVATLQNKVYAKGLTPENTSEAFDTTERRVGDTTLNRLMTKFIEIRPLTKNKVYADILNTFLLETLVVSATKGYYNKPVKVYDTSIGTYLYLYPKELLAIYNYAVNKSIGITPEFIPTSANIYKAFNTEIESPDKTIMWGDELIYISSYVDVNTYFSDLQYEQNIETPAIFSDMLTRLWLKYMSHHLMDQNTLLDTKHYVLEYLTTLCHTRRTETIELVSGYTKYEDWFGYNGLDIYSSIISQYNSQIDSKTAWANLADVIMTALVPVTETMDYFGNFTLSDFGYSRLRQLFIQMCSYKVVFLESSRSSPEFAIGSKWSSKYGPENVNTYGSRTFSTNAHFTDKSILSEEIVLDRGFSRDESTHMDSSISLNTTSATEMMGDSTMGSSDYIKVGSITTDSFSSTSVLNLPYIQMILTGIEDVIPIQTIIDNDGVLITDSDGSYIIDPNLEADPLITDTDGAIIVDSDGVPIDDPNSEGTDSTLTDSDGAILTDSDGDTITDPDE